MSIASALRGFVRVPRRSCPTPTGRLRITASDRAQAVATGGPTRPLVAIVLDHAVTSLRLAVSGIRHVTRGAAAGEAYRRMSVADFTRINGRQAWANWRTITRNLEGNLPLERPLTVVDLCCGTGDSTSVLAWWLPTGSRILGIELDPRFAREASERTYRNRHGEVIPVAVRAASAVERFRDPAGNVLADGSVDLVHAIGSIGCHFTPAQTAQVLEECARVLASDAFALLDAGEVGTPEQELAALAGQVGLEVTGRSRSWWFDRYVQLVLRRPG